MLNSMKTLFGIVLLLTGFVYYLVSQNHNNEAVGSGAWLLPMLQQESMVAQLTKIKVSKGDESLVLIKKDQDWFVEGGFYADTGPMMQLLQALRSAEKIEAKTKHPENFKQLKVSDTDLKVTLMAGEKVIASVYLGMQSSAPGASFVRLDGDNQTWLVSAIEEVGFMTADWQLKTLVDHGAENIIKVRIDNGSNAVIEMIRSIESGEWQFVRLPETGEVNADVPWQQLANGLSRFSIDAALPVDLTDKALKVTAEYTLTSGEEVVVKVFQHAADYFVTLNQEKYQRWMFKIPSYKFDALNKSMSEFIETNNEDEMSEEADMKEVNGAK